MKKTIVAICYDFDKTLSPKDMQAQGFIQSVGYSVQEFWQESNGLASENDMDQNLAYMYKMSKLSRGKILFTKNKLKEAGENVELFPGVSTWFDRINEYGKENGIEVEHYVISSGLKEMIEGTKVADKFKKIYASSFFYDETGVAVWPAQVVNYTNKTQFLFRIEKGVLDINDQGVNNYFQESEYRVPFRNMIYIGDSDTDVPCMKLVNINGGHSIGVYNPETNDKTKVFKMLQDNRIRYYVSANYEEESELEILVKSIIKRTKENEVLENIHYKCIEEKNNETYEQSQEDIKKDCVINKLEDSTSFANTHIVIKELSDFNDWTDTQKKKLNRIAEENNQVKWILEDPDVESFYKSLNGEGL